MVQQRPGTSEAGGPSGTGATDGVRLSSGVIASLSGGALLLIFMLQNREAVTLNFLVWSFSWPLWLFTLVVAVLGAFVWLGFGVLRRHRRRRARREARAD
jgi:uncharacterized integral membrane protein